MTRIRLLYQKRAHTEQTSQGYTDGMAALHFSDLQALLPELQSLLQQRLQKIKALELQSGVAVKQSPILLSFERQSCLLDLKNSQIFLLPKDLASSRFSELLVQPEQAQQSSPPAWVMLCRKYLQGHRLQSLELVAHDRIIIGVWASGAQMVIELSGRHANAFVLDSAANLLGGWRPDASQRKLTVGQPYQQPAPHAFKAETSALTRLPSDGARSVALANQYLSDQLRFEQAGLVQSALKQARKTTQRQTHILQQLQQDIDRLDRAEHWQQIGDLLQSAPDKSRRGQTEIQVQDYYALQPNLRTIPLDPRYSLAEQISKAYKLAKKIERAAERALLLWESQSESCQQSQADLARIELLWQRHQAGESLSDTELGEFSSELPRPKLPQTKNLSSGASEPRQFCSSSGLTIWVGKNDRSNHHLSTRLAKGNDYWFHLQDLPGSHVVLRTSGQQVSEQDLLDAATLAVYYSKWRAEPRVAVSYTQVKNVKSLKGGRPGQVQLKAYKTILLVTEPERLQRLKNSRNP